MDPKLIQAFDPNRGITLNQILIGLVALAAIAGTIWVLVTFGSKIIKVLGSIVRFIGKMIPWKGTGGAKTSGVPGSKPSGPPGSIVGILAAIFGVTITLSCLVWPLFNRYDSTQTANFFWIAVLAAVGGLFYWAGSQPSWWWRIASVFGLAFGISFLSDVLVTRTQPTIATAVPASLVEHTYDIPRQAQAHTFACSGKVIYLPSGHTIQICCNGNMDYDPRDDNRQLHMNPRSGFYIADARYRNPGVYHVRPESGMLQVADFPGVGAGSFPCPHAPFGVPIYRIGSGPWQELPGSWTSITVPKRKLVPMDVDLNLPRGWMMADSWGAGSQGGFTAKIRGIVHPS